MRPGVLDYVDLWLLRAAKLGRRKHVDDADFYDSFFTAEDVEKYRGDVRNLWRYGLMRRFYDAAHPQGHGRVVDIGCGLGMAALYLPAETPYAGIEFSPATVRRAREAHQAHRPHLTFESGGFPDLPLADAAADFAVCMEVVEHIRDDAGAVRELARILAPGGHLLITVPSTFYWPDYERLIGHYRHYSGAQLAGLLRAAGLEPVYRVRQHTAFWRASHYVYVALAVVERAVRLAGARRFVMYRTGAYRRLAGAILRRLEQREDLHDPGSTFVLARKVTATHDAAAHGAAAHDAAAVS